MTSSDAQQSQGNMTASRSNLSNRLPAPNSTYSMNNANDGTTPPLGGPFANAAWQTTNIWSSFARPRDTIGSRDSNDSFSNGTASGSGALAATSEADTWPSQPWPSSVDNSARNPSGNTSPNRIRSEAPVHDIMGNSSLYANTLQRAPVGSRPATNLDPSSTTFSSDYNGQYEFPEVQQSQLFGTARLEADQRIPRFGAASRQPQDTAFLNSAGAAARSVIVAPPASTDAELRYPYGMPGTHSQRSSVGGSFTGSASRAFDQGEEEEPVAEAMGRLRLGGPNGDLNGSAGMSYGSAHQAFQFNPVSQPWENGQGRQDSLAGEFERRSSVADRGSPAGNMYRNSNTSLSSPRNFPEPQLGVDPWQRPAPQNNRAGPSDQERRNQVPYIQQQPAAFYAGAYTGQNYQPLDMARPMQAPQLGYHNQMVPYHMYGAAPGSVRPPGSHDAARGVRSAVLEQFRSSSRSSKAFELRDILGHMVEFSGDQHGSRFIQGKLESANSDEKEQVFQEIRPNAVVLMKDVFGNYVIQKFFEHGNQVQKRWLADAMKGKMFDLSTQMYACRVVQKALQHVLVEQQAELVQELKPNILRVVNEQNGNHVIQKILEIVPREHLGFVYDCFRGRVGELACQMYGCRVIQRALEYGNAEDREFMMAELHACAARMVTDSYGNYVTQHVIQKGQPEDRDKMIDVVVDGIFTYSKHKFASNVVEVCIKKGTPQVRRRIMEIITGDENALAAMIKDQYGNYVIQTLHDELKEQEKIQQEDPEAVHELVKAMEEPVKKLKRTGVNTRQVNAIERRVNETTRTNMATPPTNMATPASTAPTSPALQVDVGSALPTPNLTMGPNSPSSSPPSTNSSAVGEMVEPADSKLSGSAVSVRPQTSVNGA